MIMNNIELHLPKLPTVKLGDLRKGSVFMFARDHYEKYTNVYMVTKNEYGTRSLDVISLSTGEQSSHGPLTKVVELDVTIHCEPHDDNKLPF